MADPAMADPTAGAADAPSTDDDAQGTEDSGQQVICTIMASADGGYTLIAGDEDEGGDEVSDAGAGMDAGASPMGGASAAGASQGQQFDSVGALLKGVLDLLKAHEASASGEGSDSDNFAAGFSGGSSMSPGGSGGTSANPAAMKY